MQQPSELRGRRAPRRPSPSVLILVAAAGVVAITALATFTGVREPAQADRADAATATAPEPALRRQVEEPDLARTAPMEARGEGTPADLAGEVSEGAENAKLAGSSGVLGSIGAGGEGERSGGIGGIIGTKGVQVGAGGLASRGSGLGGGGRAEGLGGLAVARLATDQAAAASGPAEQASL